MTILSGIGATGPYSRFCELNGEQSVAMNAEIATLSEVAHLLLLSKFMQIMQLMVRCQHIRPNENNNMVLFRWYFVLRPALHCACKLASNKNIKQAIRAFSDFRYGFILP